MKFNINDEIKIRLNDRGRVIYREYWRETCEMLRVPPRDPRVDADGWTTMQFHEVMRIFGSSMKLGGGLPFQTTIEIPAASNQ
jgi:hypothetical protein